MAGLAGMLFSQSVFAQDVDPWEEKNSLGDRNSYFTKIGYLVLENQVKYGSAVDDGRDRGDLFLDHSSDLNHLFVGLLRDNNIPIGDDIGFNIEHFLLSPDKLRVFVHYSGSDNPFFENEGWLIYDFVPDEKEIRVKLRGEDLTFLPYLVE